MNNSLLWGIVHNSLVWGIVINSFVWGSQQFLGMGYSEQLFSSVRKTNITETRIWVCISKSTEGEEKNLLRL